MCWLAGPRHALGRSVAKTVSGRMGEMRIVVELWHQALHAFMMLATNPLLSVMVLLHGRGRTDSSHRVAGHGRVALRTHRRKAIASQKAQHRQLALHLLTSCSWQVFGSASSPSTTTTTTTQVHQGGEGCLAKPNARPHQPRPPDSLCLTTRSAHFTGALHVWDVSAITKKLIGMHLVQGQ